MARTLTARPVAEIAPRGHQLLGTVFLVVLGGYMFFDKTFAWIHIPGIPAFGGEVLIAVGLILTAAGRLPIRRLILRSTQLRLLLLLLVLGAVRILWDMQSWGIDAARDGALIYYASVAFLSAALVWDSPAQWRRMLGAYRAAIPFFLVWAPIGMLLTGAFGQTAPTIPDSSTTWLDFKPGNMTVHIAACLAYLWLVDPPTTHRQRVFTRIWTTVGLVGIVFGASLNRGGGVAALAILAGVLILSPYRVRAFYSWVALAVGVVFLAFLLDINIDLGRRDISLEQLAANLESVVTPDEADRALAGTAQWRLDFWSDIADDALFGDQMISGWGFGPNLADIYGYNTVPVGEPGGLRSAHNSHMSVLARLGVPGLVLWGLFWFAWSAVSSHASRPVRFQQRSHEAKVVGWILLVVGGFLLAAVFDPMLESPPVGVWVWFLAGASAGITLIPFRAPNRRGLRQEAQVSERWQATRQDHPEHPKGPVSPQLQESDPFVFVVEVEPDTTSAALSDLPPAVTHRANDAGSLGERTGGSPTSAVDDVVRVNVATIDAIATLPGIGPVLAEVIVDHRETYGPFPDAEGLLDVPGIGLSRLDSIRPFVSFD